jgi:hypothetical protein
MSPYATASIAVIGIAFAAFLFWLVRRMERDAALFYANVSVFEKRAQEAKTADELRVVHFDLSNYARSLGTVPRLWASRLREVSAFINGALGKTTNRRWIYVRCLVRKADPGQVTLMSSLNEKVTGVPQPDVIPDIHSGSLSFEHAFLDARDKDEAYASGPDYLPEVPDDVLCLNDYVIETELTHLILKNPSA